MWNITTHVFIVFNQSDPKFKEGSQNLLFFNFSYIGGDKKM